MKKITIKDVAREAGVSVTLVSFVMNAKKGPDGRLDCPVNAETAKRVLSVARKLGYRRNVAAASLRSGRSNTIAVIPTDISNKFFAGISRYIEDKAYTYGYTVLFGSSDESADRLDSVMDTVLAYNIDGIIVAPVAGGESAIQKAIDVNVPVVLLDRDIESMDTVGKVLLNDVEAGRMATELLLKNGCKSVEMVSYKLDISSLQEREEGYRQVMKEKGLEAKVHYTDYTNAENDLLDVIKDVVNRGVDGLFIPTYSLSAWAMSAMKKLNVVSPDDLALVAFDESDVYKLYSTTVAHIVQPLKELGEQSVDLLHSMIENLPCEKTVILNPTLIEGGSAEKKR
jgi:LacI family transcriptional regulator